MAYPTALMERRERDRAVTEGEQSSNGRRMLSTHFLALLFAPLDHSSASAASFFACSAADFAAAASAFRAWPAAFLPPTSSFLPPILRQSV